MRAYPAAGSFRPTAGTAPLAASSARAATAPEPIGAQLAIEPLRRQIFVWRRQMPILAAAAQSRQQAGRFGATHQEIGFHRRLFQRFQQRVGRRLGQQLGVGQPDHFRPTLLRIVVERFNQLTDGINTERILAFFWR